MVDPDTTGQMKIEADATEIADGIGATILWAENAVAVAKISAWNIDAANFIANLDAFDLLKIHFRYGTDSWTKYFEGVIEDVNPILTLTDQTVVCTAYGKGRALRNTHCNTNYGKESENPTIDTPGEIWTDIVDNYVEKSFGGDATGYTITLSKNNDTLPSINHLFNPYISNMNIINQTLLLIQAYRAGLSGHHWIVGADGTLRVKRIGTDISGWPSWWNTDQAGSTLVEGTDFISYSFSKRVRSKDFANKIILATDLRKPGYDYWTENQSGLWGSSNITLSNDAAIKIVGSYSLKAEPTAIGDAHFYYPSARNATWDLSKIGSQDTIPLIIFQFRSNTDINLIYVTLGTDVDNYFYGDFFPWMQATTDKWNLFRIAFGPYAPAPSEEYEFDWLIVGSPSWSNINYLEFRWTAASTDEDVWLDDLHFTGKIIREAYNSTNITANDEHQKIVRMNTSVEDSMKQTDDSGMAARLAYAELLRAQTIPIVGTVKLYGIVDILPGQWVHIHAEKTNGSFRIDDDFRVKEVQQEFQGLHEFYTTLSLTDDLINTFAKGPADLISAYHNVMFIDPEAQSLKATGVDPLVARLSKDYP